MWGVVNDKVAHLGLYTILGVALAWGARRNGNRPAPAILVLVGVAYGVLDEWHQSFVPGRTPDGGDLIADAAGVVLGLLAFRLLISRHVSGHPNLRSDSERRDP